MEGDQRLLGMKEIWKKIKEGWKPSGCRKNVGEKKTGSDFTLLIVSRSVRKYLRLIESYYKDIEIKGRSINVGGFDENVGPEERPTISWSEKIGSSEY